jgi:Rod binding domain-containing protein
MMTTPGSITTSPAPPPAGSASGSDTAPPALRRAAEEFESVFLAQVLGQLSTGLGAPGISGGGSDDPFASMLRDEYAKVVSRSGGVGVADAVLREMLKMQEVAS